MEALPAALLATVVTAGLWLHTRMKLYIRELRHRLMDDSHRLQCQISMTEVKLNRLLKQRIKRRRVHWPSPTYIRRR